MCSSVSLSRPGPSRRCAWRSSSCCLRVKTQKNVKNMPGRKTDAADAQWLATLARAGLLRGSLITEAHVRHPRLIARQRRKLGGMLASQEESAAQSVVRFGHPAGRVGLGHARPGRARHDQGAHRGQAFACGAGPGRSPAGKPGRPVRGLAALKAESLSIMPTHHAKRRPLVVANARHSPSYGCALRLDRTPFDALLGHARKILSL